MGNDACCNADTQNLSAPSIGAEIAKSIERNDLKKLKSLLKELSSLEISINAPIIKIKGISLNPLCYSLFAGKRSFFKYLYDRGAKLEEMDEILFNLNLNAIDIICERGYQELLDFYLPLYLKNTPHAYKPRESDSSLNFSAEYCYTNFMSPVQKACEKGQISIIIYLHNYFKNQSFIPEIFDPEYPNEKNGETCALIACRKGNYPMIKTLHTICNANFHVKNKYEENAILICVCGYRNDHNYVYLECVKYLVGTIKLNVSYMYEEILILSECDELTYYIEQELQKAGISATKSEIDEKYKIKKYFSPDDLEITDINEFFSSSIRRYLNDDETKSRISSISQVSTKTDIMYANIFY